MCRNSYLWSFDYRCKFWHHHSICRPKFRRFGDVFPVRRYSSTGISRHRVSVHPAVIPKTTSISTFCVALCIFVIGASKNFKFDVQVECASHSLRTTNRLWWGRGQVIWFIWPIKNFGGSNYITGTAEFNVVKFCTQVDYINSSNRMIYHSQKWRGYCHVTVLKFARLPWCSASRGFVSDNWATCWHDISGKGVLNFLGGVLPKWYLPF